MFEVSSKATNCASFGFRMLVGRVFLFFAKIRYRAWAFLGSFGQNSFCNVFCVKKLQFDFMFFRPDFVADKQLGRVLFSEGVCNFEFVFLPVFGDEKLCVQ